MNRLLFFFVFVPLLLDVSKAQDIPAGLFEKGWYFSGSVSPLARVFLADYDVVDQQEIRRRVRVGFSNAEGGLSVAFGRQMGSVRGEVEVFMVSFPVDEQASRFIAIENSVSVDMEELNRYKMASGDVDLLAFMANVYYDFDNLGFRWVPYVGIGGGFAELNNDFFVNTDSNFNGLVLKSMSLGSHFGSAFQFKAGLTYKISRRLEAYGSYRFLVLGSENPEDLPFENEDSHLSTGAVLLVRGGSMRSSLLELGVRFPSL